MIGAVSVLLNRFDDRPLRWAGLVALAAGWFALLATVAARVAGARMATGDLELIACLVVALCLGGATLLILDALQQGFGALDAFFREALARSARRASDAARPAPAPAPASRQQVVEGRGYIGDRPYVLYGDGGVAVETLLGVRRFRSLQEAEEFVGV